MHESIFGHGIVARGAAPHMRAPRIFDDACTAPRELAGGAWLLPSAEFRPERSSLELVSPGVPPQHPLVRAARNLTSELDFFAPAMPPSVWISGTDGKTTTTALAAHLLGAPAVGNIGRSLADALGARLAVVEASSFALHYTRRAAPWVYALLDIAPDHLAWHGGFEAYLAAKLSPLERMQPGALAIVPAWLSGHFRARARVVFYAHEGDLARYFGFSLAPIYARFSGVLALDAALAAAVAVAVQGGFDAERMADFALAAHRCAEFRAGGWSFCDDSKATTAHAAEACLRSLLGRYARVHWLVGGDDKGQDLRALLRFAARTGRVAAYGIGARDNSALLGEFFEGAGWGSLREQTAAAMKAAGGGGLSGRLGFSAAGGGVSGAVGDGGAEAVGDGRRAASGCAAGGEVVALSPACASLDQFSSYAERGEAFVRFATELAEEFGGCDGDGGDGAGGGRRRASGCAAGGDEGGGER